MSQLSDDGGLERTYMLEAYETNWMNAVGKNINEIEAQLADYIGVQYAVALSSGTASQHLATKLAGEKLYGQANPNEGMLGGYKAFAADSLFMQRSILLYTKMVRPFLSVLSVIPGIWIRMRWKRNLNCIRKSNW